MSRDTARLRHRMERVLEALQDANGDWVPNWKLSQPHVGGHRFGGRIKELRDLGYKIEMRLAPDSTSVYEYRLSPNQRLTANRYRGLVCESCGWRGQEPQAIRFIGDVMVCPQCSRPLQESA